MKRIITFFIAVSMLFSLANVVLAEENSPTTAVPEQKAISSPDAIRNLTVDAQGAFLYNLETQTEVFSKAKNVRMFPASTTKIMTAIVVLEHCKDIKNTTVRVDNSDMFNYIIEDGGAHMALQKGEEFTVFDLLVGMMVASYCDVADLLAYEFGNKSISSFVKMMNDKAKEIGLGDTNFTNPHGLHDNDHYSTPHDITMLMSYAVQIPAFVEIIRNRTYTIPETEKSKKRIVQHSVLSYNEGHKYYADYVVGGKSGFTDQAGRCLVTYATKDGVSYILTLLGSNLDPMVKYSEKNVTWGETFNLLNYAYESFEIAKFCSKGDKFGSVRVQDSDVDLDIIAKDDIFVFQRKGEQKEFLLDIPETVTIDEVRDGAEMGKFRFQFDEKDQCGDYPVILSYDGSEIKIKSEFEKDMEMTVESFREIFSENSSFTVLVIILVVAIAVAIIAVKLTSIMKNGKKNHPKH